jgi:tRNA(Ile)-lysidine synthase
MLASVKETVNKHSLLLPGDRVVVAVSGGPDSVCLLDVLRRLSGEVGISLHIAHLDHMFRGEGSAGDARFVAELARSLGIPSTIERRDVPSYCAERGLSAQRGAREVRYSFLEEVARTVGAGRIAIGHTASDQAETVIMRMIRGAGLAGLSGIPPKRDHIIRPLIEVTRERVLAYLAERKITYVTDPSNLKPVYTRNRVRQEIIPVLERFNPRIVETLAAEAALIRDEDRVLEQKTEVSILDIIRKEGDRVRFDRDGFLLLETAIRRRAVRRAWELLEPSSGLSGLQTDEAAAFMKEAPAGGSMDLPGGLVLVREYGSFILRPAAKPFSFDVVLTVPGATPLPALALEAETRVRMSPGDVQEPGNYLWQAKFDYAKIALPLRLRSRRAGDSLRPAGMGGRSKKLQDLFVDEKVPRFQRDRVPLLTTDRDVLWVVGMRTDERFLPPPGAKEVLVVTIRELPSGEGR